MVKKLEFRIQINLQFKTRLKILIFCGFVSKNFIIEILDLSILIDLNMINSVTN